MADLDGNLRIARAPRRGFRGARTDDRTACRRHAAARHHRAPCGGVRPMCLLTVAIDQSRRFPLVIAGNRDEFFNRQAARLAWWSPGAGLPDILSGRDLHAGGSWLGLTAQGRLALLTNVRDPSRIDPNAPSRGEIVTRWLAGDLEADRFWMRTALSGYNGFNLIAADFQRGDCFYASNQRPNPVRLERGLYGLSNGALDTPWPKVEALKEATREALESSETVDALAARLFHALPDPPPPHA